MDLEDLLDENWRDGKCGEWFGKLAFLRSTALVLSIESDSFKATW